MASEKHLEILRAGKAAWNDWRQSNSHIRPDLRDAPLHSLDLRGFNFRGADFGGTRLTDADLEDASLQGAVLGSTRLVGTNMAGCHFGTTFIFNVDLSAATGLADADHYGGRHSAIDTHTLHHTAIGLSTNPRNTSSVETFLKGAGVRDSFLNMFRSMTGKIAEFESCFVAYSHRDRKFANKLLKQLQIKGIQCWLAEKDMPVGGRIKDEVNRAISRLDKVLVCSSESSLNSGWVKDEIRKAHEREQLDGHDIIIPLMIDRYLLDGWEDGLAADLRSRLAADFTGWESDDAKFEEQIERVVKALRTTEVARVRAQEL